MTVILLPFADALLPDDTLAHDDEDDVILLFDVEEEEDNDEEDNELKFTDREEEEDDEAGERELGGCCFCRPDDELALLPELELAVRVGVDAEATDAED